MMMVNFPYTFVILYYTLIIKTITIMLKFKGNLNGKEYDSLEEFLTALEKSKKEDNNSVKWEVTSSGEYNTDGTKNDSSSLMSIFDSSFTELLGNTFAGFFNDIFSPSCQYNKGIENKEKNDPEIASNTKEPDRHFTSKDFEHEFLFRDTTYKFTGTEEDDKQLDDFDLLLSRKLERFENIPASIISENDMKNIRDIVLDQYGHVKKNIELLDAEFDELSNNMKAHEGAIKYFNDFNIPAPENLKDNLIRYNEKLDIIENREDYENLRLNYYQSLLNGIHEKMKESY